MAVSPVTVRRAAATQVIRAGEPIVAVYGGIQGGRIYNPPTAADQGIGVVETLYYSLTGLAGVIEGAGTFPLQPGQYVDLPATTRDVTVNSNADGHKFSAYIIQPPPGPPIPVPGNFPPDAPSALQNAIPSYLYEQYYDDENLQAFVRAYNVQMQEYIDWFNNASLPIYTGPLIQGALLDWVAYGLYGMRRPTLSSGRNQDLGPYNTAMYNLLMYNEAKKVGANNVTVTTDDIFKRIMTWRLYRGDGKIFNIEWLKRRIVRFLTFPNGTSGRIEQTYDVSVTLGSNSVINILLPGVPNANILKEAIDSGAVELPFQFTYSVTISA